ncbi:hypothetical protein ACSBR1_018202 [Camellia fascicularis]
MANNRQEEKIGDDIHSESCEHADPNIGEENCNEGAYDPNPGEKDVGKEGNTPKKAGRDEYYNEGDLQEWKDRCRRRDNEIKRMTNKLVDLQLVVNFMMQNNVMQPPFPLQDTPVPAKVDAQKEGQKTIPVVPQHGKGKEHSHRPSRDVGRIESLRVDEERSKRTNNDTGSSAPKRLKSIDS